MNTHEFGRERANRPQFLDVAYESIERAPLETIERVYDFLGWPLAEAGRSAIERFLAANPKDKHGVHRYTLEEYGLDPGALKQRFGAYCERFEIPVRSEN